MDPFATELNLLFMHTYRSIHNVEEAMLKSLSNGSLSIGEMHIIECIGRGGKNGASITAIAQDMEISLPSATVAVKKLEKKALCSNRAARKTGAGCTSNSRKRAAARKWPIGIFTGKCSRPCARTCGKRKNPCCWA